MTKEKLLQFINYAWGKKCVLFGSGPTAYEFLKKVSIPIAYIVDNDGARWNETFQDLAIKSPATLLEEDRENTIVIIGSKAVDDIAEQLEGMGFRQNENIIVSPFVMTEKETDHLQQPKLLISCLGYNGGMFVVDPKTGSINKIFDGDCRGIVKHHDTYIVALEHCGFVRFDADLQVVQEVTLEENLNLHGLTLDEREELLYVCESGRDAIGIYDSHTLEKRDGIILDGDSADVKDMHHVNDVVFKNGRLYASLFSINGVWRQEIWNDGAIVILDLEEKKIRRVVLGNLKQPHSIHFVKENVLYCNSMECQVCDGERVICQTSGYTRGLASRGDFYFVGQSEMRRLSRFQDRFSNISMDCGVHIWYMPNKTSRFLPLPAQGVFDILVVE